ncbi:site-specific integrase [Nitrincola sp.]|uniref:site-specific integrase n=1 Tax=Nitrincola sp. TaxID=1926584 RepID=UPI003A93102A
MSGLITQAQRQLQQLGTQNGLTAEGEGANPLLDAPLRGERNPANVYLMRYGGTTAVTYRNRLNQCAARLGAPNGDYEWLNWAEFNAHRIQAMLQALYEPYVEDGDYKRRSPNTMNGLLVTLKGVMSQAFKMGWINRDTHEGISDIKAFKVRLELTGRMADSHETAALEAGCDAVAETKPGKAARDRAIFRLAFLSGIRRHEFSLLNLDSFKPQTEQITVLGKGGKVATLELAPETTEAILGWLQHRGFEPGALFTAVSKADRPILSRRISPSGIGYLFKDYCLRLGINNLTPHDSRRTYCSNVLDVPGIDPKTAMDMARHSSFDTTARYDRRGNEKRKHVAGQLTMGKVISRGPG